MHISDEVMTIARTGKALCMLWEWHHRSEILSFTCQIWSLFITWLVSMQERAHLHQESPSSMASFVGNPSVYTIYGVYLSLGSLIFNNGVCRETSAVFVKARSITWYHTTNRIPAVGIRETSMSNPCCHKHTNRHYQGASERHILFKIIMNICCFLTRIHSGWLERVSTWKVTVIHSLESVGCLVLFGSSQLPKSNCQRSTWLPCASHMGYSVHTPNFWTSGDLVGTSALHVQLVRRTSQHWIVIWTLCISCQHCEYWWPGTIATWHQNSTYTNGFQVSMVKSTRS